MSKHFQAFFIHAGGALVWLLCGLLPMQAQTPDELAGLSRKYPNDDKLYYEDRAKITISYGSEGLEIVRNNYLSTYYMTDRAHEYSAYSISYSSSFEQIQNLEAKVHLPSGNSFKAKSVKDFRTESATSEGVFYDDQALVRFSYPGLVKGAMTTVSHDEVIRDPHFISGFYFQRYAPIKSASFSISFPQSVRIKCLLKGDTSLIKFKREKRGGNITYTWEAKDLPKMISESAAPDARHHVPHILVFVESYDEGRERVTVFKDVPTLYKWYRQFIGQVSEEASPEVKRITDSLTQGVSSEWEKTKRIFYWVQDHVKYIAFEYGYGGFIPREAAWVCNRRFGDCKDMANILYVMLKYAGIKVHHTWIGTRDIPYTYAEVPAPAVDNHMIAVAYPDGKEVFLDATGGFLPLGKPTPMIQGKEALIGLDKDNHKIVNVPVIGAEDNARWDTTTLQYADGKLYGQSRTAFTGFKKFALYRQYYFSHGKAKREQELPKAFTRGNSKCQVAELDCRGFDDRDAATTVSYKFMLPEYATQRENELYINLALDKYWQDEEIDTAQRKLPIEFDYNQSFRTVTTLAIPAGYALARLPENVAWKKDDFSFRIAYSAGDGKVTFTQEVVNNTLLLPKDKFLVWNEMIRSLKDAYRETIVLKKVKI